LQVADEVLGRLDVSFQAGAPLTADEQEVIDLIATQAAIAIRNARLIGESEKRRQTAEALADVGRLLAGTLDPELVARRVAENIGTLLRAHHAVLFRLEPGSEDLVTMAVAHDSEAVHASGRPFPKGTPVGLAVRERRTVMTPDVLVDARFALTPDLRAHLQHVPFRAVLALPLIVSGVVRGGLAIVDRMGRVFSEDEVRLAQAFADQAALALGQAWLHEEAERRRREAELLAALAREINTSLDLDTILQRVGDAWRRSAPTPTRPFT
jgi:GAF domain-containing protein